MLYQNYWPEGYWDYNYWVKNGPLGISGALRVVFDHEMTAFDKSTIRINLSFFDELNNIQAPDSIKWSLFNSNKQIVNGRDQVPIAVDTITTIVLSGNDLNYLDGELRYLVIDSVYDSSLGVDLPLRECTVFKIRSCGNASSQICRRR